MVSLKTWCGVWLASIIAVAFLYQSSQNVALPFQWALTSYSKEETSSNTFQAIRQTAQIELDSLVFDSDLVKSQDVVRKDGFPMDWENCTIHRAKSQANGRPLQITILGGSPSASTAPMCSPYDGHPVWRYSDILQESLDNFTSKGSNISFAVSNMAHGATDSVFAGLLMDEFVDPLTTDILLWEFAINDQPKLSHEGIRVGDKHGLFVDFFLKRVHALFASVDKPPPPVILLYLWDHDVGSYNLSETDVGLGSYHLQRPTIEEYRTNLGWNIQVITVGPTINRDAVGKDKKVLWFDGHCHASCKGLYLLSDMIQEALYKDVATCSSRRRVWKESAKPRIMPAPANNMLQKLVFSDMHKPALRMASHSKVQPRLGSTTTILRATVAQTNATVNSGKALESRQDRSISYRIPVCGTGNLTLNVQEPNLQWLGLSLLSYKNNHQRIKTFPTMTVNDRSVVLPRNGKELLEVAYSKWIPGWIHLPSANVVSSETYRIAFCFPDHVVVAGELHLRFLVGLIED